MGFRDELTAARARIAQLEEDNDRLRHELARLRGELPLEEPLPTARTIGTPIWWPGHSWIFGWAPSLVAYSGEHDGTGFLRFLGIGDAVIADHALAKDGEGHVTRVRGGVVAPLADGSLALFDFPRHEAVRRISLASPLVAALHERADGTLLGVTAERELLEIDREDFRVVAWRSIDVPELRSLGFGDGDPRARQDGYAAPDPVKAIQHAGWRLAAFRRAGALTLCALNRSFAGNEQLAAGVVGPAGVLWFVEAGGGSMMYLYTVDGLLILHNVSLELEAETWGFAVESGRCAFRIRGRGHSAALEVFAEGGRVALRSGA